MVRVVPRGINFFPTSQVSFSFLLLAKEVKSNQIIECISPSVMLPEHRLAILLQQVKHNQISNCLYHNTASSPSLYQDHKCDRSNFPVHSVLEIDKHSGEVWNVKFSNNGSSFASCGQDGTCIIFDAETFKVLQNLARSEGSGICTMAWSPDDSMIVTCGLDKYAHLWNAKVSLF